MSWLITIRRAALVLLMLSFSSLSTASDLEREKRLSDQIIDAIFDGEPFFLEADGHEFLSIYMEADDSASERAVLLIHGRGYHPDWEQVVQPLRVGLTEHGWNTLSIQMPVLAKDAKYYDYIPTFGEGLTRIDAALQYLKSKGNKQVVMIAHSCGVHLSMAWIGERGTSAIDGYIGIGMGATDYKQPMPEPFPFDNIDVPVFDLYGAMDYPAVLNGAPERWAAIKEQAQSRQLMLPGADHYMSEQDKVLVETVADWLGQTFADR